MCDNNRKIAEALGTRNWCVAARATPRLRSRYEVILTPCHWAKLKVELKLI